MTNVKQNFQLVVWFRYVYRGEQEKDFETHNIEANNLQEAVNKASDLYRSHRAIPFQFLHNGEQQKPTIITKEDIFNLTAPVL